MKPSNSERVTLSWTCFTIQALCHGAVVWHFAHVNVLQVLWKFSHPPCMGFVDSEKACFIHSSLFGRSMGNTVGCQRHSHELSNSCSCEHWARLRGSILFWTECREPAELNIYISDPEYVGGIMYPTWSSKASGSPRESWRRWLGRRTSGLPC